MRAFICVTGGYRDLFYIVFGPTQHNLSFSFQPSLETSHRAHQPVLLWVGGVSQHHVAHPRPSRQPGRRG